MQQDELRDICRPFGEIKRCCIVKDQETQRPRGIAFVHFDNADQASAALRALSEKPLPANIKSVRSPVCICFFFFHRHLVAVQVAFAKPPKHIQRLFDRYRPPREDLDRDRGRYRYEDRGESAELVCGGPGAVPQQPITGGPGVEYKASDYGDQLARHQAAYHDGRDNPWEGDSYYGPAARSNCSGRSLGYYAPYNARLVWVGSSVINEKEYHSERRTRTRGRRLTFQRIRMNRRPREVTRLDTQRTIRPSLLRVVMIRGTPNTETFDPQRRLILMTVRRTSRCDPVQRRLHP